MYDLAVGAWGIQPSEFWSMTPAEWWRLFDIKRERDPQTDYAGSLTDNACEELYELLEE